MIRAIPNSTTVPAMSSLWPANGKGWILGRPRTKKQHYWLPHYCSKQRNCSYGAYDHYDRAISRTLKYVKSLIRVNGNNELHNVFYIQVYQTVGVDISEGIN